MPFLKGFNLGAIGRNIANLIGAGHTPEHAAGIAYNMGSKSSDTEDLIPSEGFSGTVGGAINTQFTSVLDRMHFGYQGRSKTEIADRPLGGESEPAPRPDAKPGPYITQLTAAEQPRFAEWVKTNNVPYDPSPHADYDMPGFWRALQAGSSNASTGISKFDHKMHYTDFHKTPYHKTFSNESKYALPSAPHWEGDVLYSNEGQVVADETPRSKTQLRGNVSMTQQEANTPDWRKRGY